MLVMVGDEFEANKRFEANKSAETNEFLRWVRL
jgi:hypothetical protein